MRRDEWVGLVVEQPEQPMAPMEGALGSEFRGLRELEEDSSQADFRLPDPDRVRGHVGKLQLSPPLVEHFEEMSPLVFQPWLDY